MSGGGLVTVGETMVLLHPDGIGRLRHATTLRVGIGGAESNVAIGVARLGLPAAWVGRVGDDEFGELILATLRGAGVDITGAVRDPAVPTSLMVKERRTATTARVLYYRRGGPGARLHPDDINADQIAAADMLHVTGITPALGGSSREALDRAIDIAHKHDVPVSLDVNYRAALWSAEQARDALRPLVAHAQVVFAGDDEATMLGCTGDPQAQARQLTALGPASAVIKLGARGAVAVIDGAAFDVPAVPVPALDPVGAGDAFVAGYLTELLAGEPPDIRLATAARCGAFAVTVPGDWEGLPTRADLTTLNSSAGTVLR